MLAPEHAEQLTLDNALIVERHYPSEDRTETEISIQCVCGAKVRYLKRGRARTCHKCGRAWRFKIRMVPEEYVEAIETETFIALESLAGPDRRRFDGALFRRWTADRVEVGDRAAAFVDARLGADTYVWDYGPKPAHRSYYPSKRIGLQDRRSSLRMDLFRLLREGGEPMADQPDVIATLMSKAEKAKAALDKANDQIKDVRKAARALADTGLLSKEQEDRVNELFPKREKKATTETPTPATPATPATP